MQNTNGSVPLPARTHQQAAALFRRPFAPGAIGFRAMSKVAYGGDPFGGAQVAAYVAAQSVLQRLNAVVPGRWCQEFRPVDPPPGAKCLYLACRLIVKLPVTEDGPDVDAVYEDVGEMATNSRAGLKALYSDARKRAAVAAGIGAYLYTSLAAVVLPIGPRDRQVQLIRRSAGPTYWRCRRRPTNGCAAATSSGSRPTRSGATSARSLPTVSPSRGSDRARPLSSRSESRQPRRSSETAWGRSTPPRIHVHVASPRRATASLSSTSVRPDRTQPEQRAERSKPMTDRLDHDDEPCEQRWPMTPSHLLPRERWLWWERLWSDVVALGDRYRIRPFSGWWENRVHVETFAALAAWVERYDCGEWDDPPGKLALLYDLERVRELVRGAEPFHPDRERGAFVRFLIDAGCQPPPGAEWATQGPADRR